MTSADEQATSAAFLTEDEHSGISLCLRGFNSELTGFRFLFDPEDRNTWSYTSVTPCKFQNGVVYLRPGSSLVTKDNRFNDFVLKGELQIFKGNGTLIVGFVHPDIGQYRIIFGSRCGVVYDPGGIKDHETLWKWEKKIVCNEWTPFEISVRKGILFLQIRDFHSGPIKGLSIDDTEVFIRSENCYGGFKELVAGVKKDD